MHFAYAPRKNSDPPPFLPRSSRFPTLTLRRSRVKVIALAGLAFVGLLFLILRPGQKTSHPSLSQHIPSGKPPAVLVTVYDETNYPKSYLDTVRDNRRQYAEKHGMHPRRQRHIYIYIYIYTGCALILYDLDLRSSLREWAS